jgi:hypothetical protein
MKYHEAEERFYELLRMIDGRLGVLELDGWLGDAETIKKQRRRLEKWARKCYRALSKAGAATLPENAYSQFWENHG